MRIVRINYKHSKLNTVVLFINRNIPLSILLSLPLCMVIYVLVNVSYFTVMSKDELLASNAVAVVSEKKNISNLINSTNFCYV